MRIISFRTPSKRTKKVKTGHALPEWGKNLPDNVRILLIVARESCDCKNSIGFHIWTYIL